jgi:hypothetical protein
MKRIFAFAAVALTFSAAQAQAQQPLAFVACPILRDTATVPCWLAEYKGELYYLVTQDGASAEVYPPSLGHQALVEGVPTGQTRCGGKVLTNLHISVRPDRAVCDAMLPATDAFQITDESGRSGPDSARPGAATGSTPPSPEPTERKGTQRFEVFYDFDAQTAGRNTAVIADAAAYSLANPKAEVHVTGFRAAVRLTGGPVLSEEESIGIRRAHELVDTLVTLGLERGLILVVDQAVPELGDHTRRHAFIDIVMGGGDEPDSEH